MSGDSLKGRAPFIENHCGQPFGPARERRAPGMDKAVEIILNIIALYAA